MMRIRSVAMIAAAMSLMSACAGSGGSATTLGAAEPGETVAQPTTIEESTTTTPNDPEPEDTSAAAPTSSNTAAPATGTLPERAVADLAARLEIDPREIRLVSFEEMSWPDGSIGCPQPGMRYTQVIINGSKVVLEANDVLYNYHIGGNRDLFLCEQPSATDKTPPPTIEF